MTLALTSTCVGGRRAGHPMPVLIKRTEAIHLTPRQTQVIDAVIRTGYCNRAAEQLGMSVKTIEAHMLHMRTRACLDSNYQLIAAYVAGKNKG